MAKFFIDRPVFAWVLALFIIVAGAISITQLPIAQYPTIAPPSILITATYPGASAKTLDDAVTSIIEQEMNGADGLLYIESVSQAGNGQATITVTFKPGTDPALAQVDVQNRLKRVEARLPSSVTQQGVQVDKTRSNFLLFATLISKDGKMDPVALGDYISRNVLNEIKRVPGVGQAVLFGTERAMRIWVDPAKLVGYKLTPTDVYNAIRNQNALVSAGTLGDLPSTSDQPIAATVVVEGQMTTTEQFGNIVLVSKPDGSQVRVKDVARLELGGQTYATSARINGQPISAIGVQLSPTGNALGTAKAVKAKLDELSKYFPAGVEYKIPYDTSKFVQISIEEVVKTLFEAMALVFLVMLVFLQNIRYTLIPSIVVPISLLGAFATMNALGFSINVLIMSQEGLPPREATRKAMGQITGAIIGITLVLMAVFIPMAFFSGSVGAIYRQFSLSMVASIFFSALMALTLTPALCSTLLKPIEKSSHHEKKGFFGWFNRMFTSTTNHYQSLVERVLKKTFRYMVIYGVLIGAVVVLFMRLPSSFLPNEDQGYIITNIQLPPAASANRTLDVIKQVERYYQHEKAVENIVAVQGFSFSGNGPNAALVFTTLKDWSQRGADQTADAVAGRAFGALFGGIRDAIVFPLNPPPIPELGNATGFTFRLQDRGGLGHDALMAARNQLLGMAAQSKVLKSVRPDGLEDSPQYQVDIDREKANALGVAFADINAVLSTALGSAYANDFPNYGRQQRVIVQADRINRMQPEDIMNLFVRNTQGSMVPMSAFAKGHWIVGPVQLVRYNGYPSIRISGDAATGASTGEAMDEMERLASKLPAGIGFEWTGQSLQEKSSGSQAPALYALSLLAVFLVLAALYESWSIPAAVILVVPLGVLGALLGVTLRVMPDDVYFKVGLIAVVGLSAKNAILIIEFAKDLQAQGKGLIEATLEAVHLRFRPIIMTSFAFILGVLPLAIATGASSASQRKGSERQRRLDAAHLPLDEEI
ncbi:multidrug efflux RND transporter permease subunit [Ralstonia solanacearum]|nr:multidrug efflux RND transporter permease subunit [Ralstonia solanacearum]